MISQMKSNRLYLTFVILRDVWQMYLDKEEFDLAREYCKVSE